MKGSLGGVSYESYGYDRMNTNASYVIMYSTAARKIILVSLKIEPTKLNVYKAEVLTHNSSSQPPCQLEYFPQFKL